MPSLARLAAVFAIVLPMACCCEGGAAGAVAHVSRRRNDRRLVPQLGHGNHENKREEKEAGASYPLSSPPSDTILADLLHVMAQRLHLNPRPRLLPFIINPFSPLLLCDLHYGAEKEPDPDIVINPLHENGTDAIRPCATVCVNAKSFKVFATDVLPRIRTSIILMTSRYHLPQVERSQLTDTVKAHPAISHWFAQNPVYPGDDRYTAFPYGIKPNVLEEYGAIFLAYHTYQQAATKNKTIEHLPFAITHPSRKPFVTGHVRNASALKPVQFYERIVQARFLISPRGDRPDTYRHWEAIGLGALPIANINRALYGSLFGEDMVYMEDADKIVGLLDEREHVALEQQYHAPSAHRLSSLFWARQVGEARDACLKKATARKGVHSRERARASKQDA